MTTEFRNVCAELLAAIQLYTKLNPAASDMSPFELTEKLMDTMAATGAALAQPVAEGPSDEELLRLAREWDSGFGSIELRFAAYYARAVLARWCRPTPQPVAVSERPWERDGWCDEQGRCWWTANKPGPLPPSWWMVSIPQSCTDGIMLPANALPTPEATNDLHS